MKFCEPETYYRIYRKHSLENRLEIAPPTKYYDATLNNRGFLLYEASLGKESGVHSNQLLAEREWYRSNNPYFTFHPELIEAFTDMQMDIPAKYIQFPRHPSWAMNGGIMRCFIIRLPEESTIRADQDHPLRTIAVWLVDRPYHTKLRSKFGDIVPVMSDENDFKMMLWLDIGEREQGSPVWTYHTLLWTKEDTIDQATKKLPVSPSRDFGVNIPDKLVKDAIRLALTVCFLMGSDSILIRPDVLTKHKGQTDKDLHKIAYDHGKYGWEIGYHDLFAKPHSVNQGEGLHWAHYRKMHWHVVRFGPGKTERKIALYMGTVVRPDLPFKT
jgi:hypothetical protein